jgi:hypothetical protein
MSPFDKQEMTITPKKNSLKEKKRKTKRDLLLSIAP